MKNKIAKLILVCLSCITLVAGLVWAIQTWSHR